MTKHIDQYGIPTDFDAKAHRPLRAANGPLIGLTKAFITVVFILACLSIVVIVAVVSLTYYPVVAAAVILVGAVSYLTYSIYDMEYR